MSEFPSGVDRYEVQRRLAAFELDSKLNETAKSLFGEGPHLVSSADLPWGDEVRHLVKDAYMRFIHAETWMTGKGLFEMEREVITWIGTLLGGGEPVGLITSGGTESNLCALLTAKAKSGRSGSVVFPTYTHYSITKGCEMFGLRPVSVAPPGNRHTGVPADALEDAVTDDTIAIVATAGTFPFGTIDDIAAIADVARRRDLYLHVDACCGGYTLPFVERHPDAPRVVPPWDFRVAGVCSISADLHKHGMVPPPASSIVFRDESLLAHARAICPPHGAISGTRPGGPIAAAWTMMTLLGVEGYCKVAAKCLDLRDELIAGLGAIEGLQVYPGSHINIFTAFSEVQDLHPVWVSLRKKGWMLSNRTAPLASSLVFWTLPQNDGVIESLLEDLVQAVASAPVMTGAPTVPRPAGFDSYGDIWDEVD